MKRTTDFYMHTTKIEPTKTAGEIQHLLSRRGVQQILMEYEAFHLVGLTFVMDIQGKFIPFKLPVRWDKCLAAMKNQGVPRQYCNEEQARRTAWRNVYRWLQAQFALSDTDQVEIAEVLLPYMYMGKETLYEKLVHNGFKMIPEKT